VCHRKHAETLRNLAARSGREGEFAGRLADIRSRHAKKGNFLKGLDAEGLGGAGPAGKARTGS